LKIKDFKYFALVTFYQPFLYFIGESYGVKLVSSTLSAVIISTIPLFTVIVSSYFYKEKITKMNITGIILSVIGVSLVIFNKDENLMASPLGISMLFLAVLAGIAYSIVIKKLSHKYNSITIVTYHNIIGIFYFLPLFFIFDYKDFSHTGFSIDAWVPLLELAIFGSSFAFIFFTYAIKKLGITSANAFTNMIPVFTAIFAFYVLDETLNLLKIVGILIVICGLFLSQIKTSTLKEKLKILIKPNE
ncbi:MAG: DMT family transporter, partial [Bacteroidota bacterium]|nr:DMT family transporter [Bacteroidota bacterium]